MRKLGLDDPPPPWTEAPTDVYGVVRMFLFALKENGWMRPVTGKMVNRARGLLGLELEQADEEGIRNWEAPHKDDLRGRLESCGIDPISGELLDVNKFKQALEALEAEQAEIKRRKAAREQRTVTGELKPVSNATFTLPWRAV